MPEKQAVWETVVYKIVVFLYELFKDTTINHADIHVEMIALELTKKVYYESIHEESPLYSS